MYLSHAYGTVFLQWAFLGAGELWQFSIDPRNDYSRQPICNEYHQLMRISKYHVMCKNCRWLEQKWGEKWFLVHPVSGWWEPGRMSDSSSTVCSCTFCDACGFHLVSGTPFLANVKILREESNRRSGFCRRQLRISDVVDDDLVEYYDSLDDDFNVERDGPQLTVEDIITVSAFSKLSSAARSFLQSKTLCWVLQSRRSLFIVCFLCLKHVLRFSFCSRGIWCALSVGQSDAQLVNCYFMRWSIGHTFQERRHVDGVYIVGGFCT